MQTNWANEHLDALREYLAKGMSYSETAKAINARFKTAYSRSAAIGRARRMGVASPGRAKDLPVDLPKHRPAPPQVSLPQPAKSRERHVPEFIRRMPIFARTQTVKLRCVEVDPRRIALTALRIEDCRYPYGGDKEGESITFCGHRIGTIRGHRLTSPGGGSMKRGLPSAWWSPHCRRRLAHLHNEIQFLPTTEVIRRATSKA
jgi:GcrA cell cycle regulator